MYQVSTRWDRFEQRIQQRGGDSAPASVIDEEFPFHKFFENAPQPLFKKQNYEEDLAVAESCYR